MKFWLTIFAVVLFMGLPLLIKRQETKKKERKNFPVDATDATKEIFSFLGRKVCFVTGFPAFLYARRGIIEEIKFGKELIFNVGGCEVKRKEGWVVEEGKIVVKVLNIYPGKMAGDIEIYASAQMEDFGNLHILPKKSKFPNTLPVTNLNIGLG